MKIHKISALLIFALLLIIPQTNSMNALGYEESSGALLYHSYSSYDAMDSMIYRLNTVTNEISVISSPEFINAMNADFGSHMYDITFMAIDSSADEWDIYRFNSFTGEFTNLTPNSGCRNEDPKFSPDGKKIVFKRGYWSSELNDFIYNLAEIDLGTMKITMLTNDIPEDSMPYYSPDGKMIYYALSQNSSTSICALNRESLITDTLYSEENVHVYYPICSDSGLYFAKWFSSDNRNDCIVKYADGNLYVLPFNNEEYNCSDPFPLDNGNIFYSSTINGSYDIFYFDGAESLPIEITATDRHELGSSCFTRENAENITKITADHLLSRSSSDFNMDADGDGEISVFDMILMRNQLD